MTAETAIRHRIDDRRGLLMERLELILAADSRGDCGSTLIELELLGDEFEFLCDMYRVLWLTRIRDSTSGPTC